MSKQNKVVINLKRAHLFMTTMAAWIREGGSIVSVEEAERRSQICIKCPMNSPKGKKGCAGCFSRKAIFYLLGNSHYKMEPKIPVTDNKYKEELTYCEVCRCDLSLKVFLPLEAIQSEGLEYPKECWQLDNESKQIPQNQNL